MPNQTDSPCSDFFVMEESCFNHNRMRFKFKIFLCKQYISVVFLCVLHNMLNMFCCTSDSASIAAGYSCHFCTCFVVVLPCLTDSEQCE